MFGIIDFEGPRLKIKALTGFVGLEVDLCKTDISDGLCKSCKHGREDIGNVLYSFAKHVEVYK